MPMMKSALSRHSLSSLSALLAQALATEGSIKGFADGGPWDSLAALITSIAQPG